MPMSVVVVVVVVVVAAAREAVELLPLGPMEAGRQLFSH